ncbi:MAG TPA: hypothetical protein VJR48_07740 [Ktedonobacterales bacterium]|jgi:hypothetical protein|nr:hypothetical protein [Ktedonobacterales bacterium]
MEHQQRTQVLSDETLATKEGWISGNSDFHYNEHIKMFQTWLAGRLPDEATL